MVSAVNVGSINLPKMMRHISHRTSQVRDLVFVRDPIYNKEVMTTKDINKDGTRTDSLAGPAVSFGYESSTNTTIAGTAVNTAYHVSSPELVFPGLKALQSPIASRSGQHQRSGHRITGACKFYLPPLSYIKQLPEFGEIKQFGELETYDKLIDIERIINKFDDRAVNGGSGSQRELYEFPNPSSGYEIDRLQFKVYSDDSKNIDYIEIVGSEGGAATELRWTPTTTFTLTASGGEFKTFDFPLRGIAAGDTTTIYKDGAAFTFTASTTTTMTDLDKYTGEDSSNRIDGLEIRFNGQGMHEIKDIFVYKQAEWRIDSIKDYRDEYMQISAVRVRGDRTSRRRAYG